MRLVIQRVSRASVAIEGRTVSGIGERAPGACRSRDRRYGRGYALACGQDCGTEDIQ